MMKLIDERQGKRDTLGMTNIGDVVDIGGNVYIRMQVTGDRIVMFGISSGEILTLSEGVPCIRLRATLTIHGVEE